MPVIWLRRLKSLWARDILLNKLILLIKMAQKQSLEGKIIFSTTRDVGSLLSRLKREIEVVGHNEIIKKLRENDPNGIYAVVLVYPTSTNNPLESDLGHLTSTINEAHSLGYDDSKLLVYSSVSLEAALGGTFIIPFRHEDSDVLIARLNKAA